VRLVRIVKVVKVVRAVLVKTTGAVGIGVEVGLGWHGIGGTGERATASITCFHWLLPLPASGTVWICLHEQQGRSGVWLAGLYHRSFQDSFLSL